MLYLYSAATDLARLKGDAALAELMRRKWTNVVSRKLYLTGGLGHSQHGEGFAKDYDLPNDIAYCETCAAIANVFWQQRLFLASGDAAYVDVLERSLYNNVLAGVALEGDRFFYVNPLTADGRRTFNQGLTARFAWTGCPCCPVNLVRLIPRVGDYFYAAQGNDVFVNLFASGQTRIRVPGGELALRQDTRYPWDGRVRLEIEAAPEEPVSSPHSHSGLGQRPPRADRSLPLCRLPRRAGHAVAQQPARAYHRAEGLRRPAPRVASRRPH